MPVQVKLEGYKELQKALGEVASDRVLRDAMEAATERVRTQIAVYPPPPAGAKQVWKSRKQIAWFFAALRRGEIQVPYRRTGTLGRRWTTRVSGGGLEITGEVGNNTTYGPFVQSEAQQAPIHQGRWRTAETVAREMEPSIQRLFVERIEQAMP